ncbi:cupin domain-containing protein [Breoghania sp.]|uniref:cupin domain-containing protein n=1 Tax=Breoghania sp. TaxID=2065378 RepID=UPI002AABFE39|nr:cupin domain-containing protein [Breoghania sp.]
MAGSNLDLSVEDVVRQLNLKPHPEGGFYRETFRDAVSLQGRARSTAIYFLVPSGIITHWHKVDAVEVWHYYAGAPLTLSLSDGKTKQEITLGPNIAACQQPQAVVPEGIWQQAETLGTWTLVGCTVAPGFEFDGFELAADGWEPGKKPD